MARFDDKTTVTWNVHLKSSPLRVYQFLSTDEGRKRWWSSKSSEVDGHIHLGFGSFKILDRVQNERFQFNCIGGTVATFSLTECTDGSTDLNICETGIPNENHFLHNYPGWVEVLLVLKAAADFDIDLRSHLPGKTWDDDFVDV